MAQYAEGEYQPGPSANPVVDSKNSSLVIPSSKQSGDKEAQQTKSISRASIPSDASRYFLFCTR